MPDSCPAFGCTNRRSTTSLQFYCIPSAKRYPEQRITKWVTAKNDRLRKQTTLKYAVLILQPMSHRSFQKHEFLQFIKYFKTVWSGFFTSTLFSPCSYRFYRNGMCLKFLRILIAVMYFKDRNWISKTAIVLAVRWSVK